MGFSENIPTGPPWKKKIANWNLNPDLSWQTNVETVPCLNVHGYYTSPINICSELRSFRAIENSCLMFHPCFHLILRLRISLVYSYLKLYGVDGMLMSEILTPEGFLHRIVFLNNRIAFQYHILPISVV